MGVGWEKRRRGSWPGVRGAGTGRRPSPCSTRGRGPHNFGLQTVILPGPPLEESTHLHKCHAHIGHAVALNTSAAPWSPLKKCRAAQKPRFRRAPCPPSPQVPLFLSLLSWEENFPYFFKV